MGVEIERKFLIRELPRDLESFPYREIEQAYLCVYDPVIRVRREIENGVSKCYLTYKHKKSAENLETTEYNLWISGEAYETLSAKREGRIIKKKRYLIPCGEYTIELDVFGGDLAPLVFAEVEFPSAAQARAFAAPDWFAEDVTDDKHYHNSWLATKL